MSKLKKLDPKLVTRDVFANQLSYNAALYTVEICNHIITRSNAGDLVLHYEDIINPHFELRFSDKGEFTDIVLKVSENACVSIVGSDWLEGKIYCTKRDIREYFKLWRVAKITNVSKVTDLTK